MAMEANAASMPAVKPLQRPQSAGNTGAVSRRDGGSSSSPFAPQTNVSIKNSIADMAGVLSKISTNESMAAEEIPQPVQKMIQNVLSSAFSLNSTLAEGLGSTMESQRFSLEQLTTLSRMLSQMGTLTENGAMGELSDSLQTLLQNIKGYTSDGNSLEPVLLNKTAFQLLDTKTADDLPAALQLLMGQLAAGGGSTQQLSQNQSEALGFLKQLMQYFMPTQSAESGAGSSTGNGSQQTGSGAQTMAGTAGNTTAGSTTANGMNGRGTAASSGGTTAPAGQPQASAGSAAVQQEGPSSPPTAKAAEVPQQGRTAAAVVPGQAASETEAAAGRPAQQNAPGAGQQAANTPAGNPSAGTTGTQARGNMPAANPQAAAAANPEQNPEQMPGAQGNTGTAGTANAAQATAQETAQPGSPQAQTGQTASNAQSQSGASQTAASAQSLPLENTPQTMDTMKSLASLLLKDADLTEKDASLLQNFVNGNQTALSEKDAKQLQLLLRLCQHNMPAAVQQAANQSNMEGMPKLWAFMQLCELTTLKELKSQELKQAGKRLSEFTSAIKHSMGGDNSNVEGQRSMSFMMPLYMGENEKSFPAYIHVYDEEKQSESGEAPQKETWLRLCVLTDNIGAVELTCRLYEDQKLNLRVFFSDPTAVEAFQEYVPELKANLQESPLELTDLKVGAAGGRL